MKGSPRVSGPRRAVLEQERGAGAAGGNAAARGGARRRHRDRAVYAAEPASRAQARRRSRRCSRSRSTTRRSMPFRPRRSRPRRCRRSTASPRSPMAETRRRKPSSASKYLNGDGVAVNEAQGGQVARSRGQCRRAGGAVPPGHALRARQGRRRRRREGDALVSGGRDAGQPQGDAQSRRRLCRRHRHQEGHDRGGALVLQGRQSRPRRLAVQSRRALRARPRRAAEPARRLQNGTRSRPRAATRNPRRASTRSPPSSPPTTAPPRSTPWTSSRPRRSIRAATWRRRKPTCPKADADVVIPGPSAKREGKGTQVHATRRLSAT